MLKKLLAGFIGIALTLTGMPIMSYAAVEVGDNLKLFGDFRMRFEFDKDTDKDGEDLRERPRIRLRFGAKYQTAIDPLSFGFRLATASSSLNSPHQTLGLGAGGGANADFGLDRAFLKYKFLESGVLIAGKQGYPLWQQTEQFWDGDIQPEGYAAAYTASLGDAGSITAVAAYYYVSNNSWEENLFSNDTVTAWQVAHKGKFGDIKSTIALTALHTSDGDHSGDWAGVSLTSGDCAAGTPIFLNPSPCTGGIKNNPIFGMVSAQIKGNVDNIGWSIGADYHKSNADVHGQSDDHDKGFVIQVRGNMDKYGVRYYYYNIEEFAVPSYAGTLLSQDNLPAGSNAAPVGFEGHRIQLDYKIAKGVSADLRLYLVEGKSDNYGYGETADDKRTRVQLNLNTKF